MRLVIQCGIMVGYGMLAVAAAACDPSRDGASHRDSGETDGREGSAWTLDPTDGLWGEAERWTISEDWRIGAVDGDGPELFGSWHLLTSVGPHGQIFVADFQSAEIRVFDREGAFVRSFGGSGRGPGELASPLALAWDPGGRLWIPEMGGGRYSVFDSTGQLLEIFPRQAASTARWAQSGAFDATGALLDEVGLNPRDGREWMAFVRIDSLGAVIDTLPPLVEPMFFRGRTRPVGVPTRAIENLLRYRARLVYATGPDDTVWLAHSDDPRLIQRSLSGDTLRVVGLRHQGGSVPANAERRIRDELRTLNLDPEDFVYGRQVIRDLLVLEDGHLLVQIEEVAGEDSDLLEVYDPEGRFLGSIRAPFTLDSNSKSTILGDTIVAVTKDDLGVAYVVRATLHR